MVRKILNRIVEEPVGHTNLIKKIRDSIEPVVGSYSYQQVIRQGRPWEGMENFYKILPLNHSEPNILGLKGTQQESVIGRHPDITIVASLPTGFASSILQKLGRSKPSVVILLHEKHKDAQVFAETLKAQITQDTGARVKIAVK